MAGIRSELTRPAKVQLGRSAIVGTCKHLGGTKRGTRELSDVCPRRSCAVVLRAICSAPRQAGATTVRGAGRAISCRRVPAGPNRVDAWAVPQNSGGETSSDARTLCERARERTEWPMTSGAIRWHQI